MINYNRAEFVLSAASPSGFIADGMPQIAFAGRSNVGKSSVINKLVNRKNFARASSSPGKTAHVNYFRVDGAFYITDLPGYGYAKVSDAEKQRWSELMEAYFARRDILTAGILIVDARHKPTADDMTMFNWFKNSKCPVVVAANKCDKCKKSELDGCIERIQSTLELGPEDQLIRFSAETGLGRDALAAAVERLARSK